MQPDKVKIRTRFAPSPTGYLHIGSARTAFFNWLFTMKNSGRFILRIEDTDIKRHMEETIDQIMESLKWLGITWDEGPDVGGGYGPYRQSERKRIYKEYAEKLIMQNKAYRCFCSPEKLAEKRKVKSVSDHSYKYDRECLNLSDTEIQKNLKNKVPYAIRLLIPDNRQIIFSDNVYGKISINSNNIDDYIILRSNDLPTYNFSAAVDDILMKITHVIRGEDHLSNTPKQILIYKAFNNDIPSFTHLPMILGQDGKKLSKRHGSISIEAYREEGFLPRAIQNYLALLGWAYNERSNIFSTDDLIDKFNLKRINKKPAKFDYDKLIWLNKYYIRNSSDKTIVELIFNNLEKQNIGKEKINTILPKIIPLIKERIKTISEAEEWINPFFSEVTYTEEIKQYYKNKKDTAIKVIDNTIKRLDEIKKFDKKNIEKNLRELSDELDFSLRKIAEVIRIAIWGSKVSPPIFATIEILGKKTTLKRLNNYRKFY